jgi:hypothetical protein
MKVKQRNGLPTWRQATSIPLDDMSPDETAEFSSDQAEGLGLVLGRGHDVGCGIDDRAANAVCDSQAVGRRTGDE